MADTKPLYPRYYFGLFGASGPPTEYKLRLQVNIPETDRSIVTFDREAQGRSVQRLWKFCQTILYTFLWNVLKLGKNANSLPV